MARQLGPNPGFVFERGAQQTGEIWVTEAIRIINTKIPAQADSTAATVADLRTDFNTLLASLRSIGLMEE